MDIIDINVTKITEEVTINATPSVTIVNINTGGGGGGGATNLSYTPSPTNGKVNSDTGTDATIPLANVTNAGLLSPAEKTKILDSLVAADLNDIENDITNLEITKQDSISQDIIDALENADNPNISNPFATIADLSALGLLDELPSAYFTMPTPFVVTATNSVFEIVDGVSATITLPSSTKIYAITSFQANANNNTIGQFKIRVKNSLGTYVHDSTIRDSDFTSSSNQFGSNLTRTDTLTAGTYTLEVWATRTGTSGVNINVTKLDLFGLALVGVKGEQGDSSPTPTLAEVLTEGNSVAGQEITSSNQLCKLVLDNGMLRLAYNDDKRLDIEDGTFNFTSDIDVTINQDIIVTQSGIIDFETTTQLNARSTDDRNRANHTGTQLASTISDFFSQVRATVLTGISFAVSTAVTATDSILVAIGKLQAQATINATNISNNVTALGLKSDKLLSAYSMRVNNTNAGANGVETTYRAAGKQTYTGAIIWSGTTAPSGATMHSYNWERIGNMVNVTLHLNYSVAGSTLTAVQLDLPSDMPTPLLPDGISVNLDVAYVGQGILSTSTQIGSSTVGRSAIRVNTSNASGTELYIIAASSSFKNGWLSLTYYTA